MTERQKVILAFCASICLHLLLLLLLMLWAELWHDKSPSAHAPEEPKSIEVTLVPNPTPTPAPPAEVAMATPTPTPEATPGKVIQPMKMVRSFLDITGLHRTEKAPDNPLFESDTNSEAGSELPATGSLPLPSQLGKERPFAEFANIDYSLGKAKPAPMSDNKKKVASEPTLEVTEPKVKEMEEPSPEMPEPLATPTPLPHNAFALAKPTPVPRKTTPTPTPAVAEAQPTPTNPPRLELPRSTVTPGYQPHKETTKIEGSISNRGKSGVAAIGTPLGRYKKAIADAIGSRWYFYINQRMDLITVGDVHIKFYVNEKGRVEDVRKISNTANDTFLNYCILSVTEAQIPQPPPDVLSRLNQGRLEIEYHFTLYPQ